MPTRDRIRQVKTTRLKHGKDHYKLIGKMGGDKTPTKFTSETGKAAAAARWKKDEDNG